jgi:hypothetical protein
VSSEGCRVKDDKGVLGGTVMSARKSLAVVVVVFVVALVVTIVVVMVPKKDQSKVNPANGSNAATRLADAAGGPAAPGVAVHLSALVLELDMRVPAGQALLDAVGADGKREGVLDSERLLAVMGHRSTANTLANTQVVNWVGSTATLETNSSTRAGVGAGAGVKTATRDIRFNFVATSAVEGSIAVDASFRMMNAEGRFEVLAEEWGLPLGERRSASASGVFDESEALFLRRRFGRTEILIIVTGAVVPGEGSQTGETGAAQQAEGDEGE